MTIATFEQPDVLYELHNGERYVLSSIEAAELSSALQHINTSEHVESPAALKAECDAEQVLLSIGPKVLPELKNHFLGSNYSTALYEFGRWCSALAEPEDLDFLLDVYKDSRFQPPEHGDAFYVISSAMRRITFEIRDANPQDPRLGLIKDEVTQMLKSSSVSERYSKTLYILIGMTGSKVDDVWELPLDFTDYVNGIATNISRARASAPNRERFVTWPEYVDEEPSLQVWVDQQSRLRLSKSSTESLLVAHEQREAKIRDDIVERVETICENLDFAPTCMPVVRLSLFNFLNKNRDAEEKDIALKLSKLKHLSDLERESAKLENPLPTIGIEVEIPKEYFTGDKESILKSLGIPHYMEGIELVEVNARFSYNAWIQARMLQELVEFDAMPITRDEKTGLRKKKPDSVLSLHVNFGTPLGISMEEMNNVGDTLTFSDMLTYAYVSPQRLRERKTTLAYRSQTEDLQPSSKTAKRGGTSQVARFELRTGEFSDFSTYRQLVETQRLTAMLFASVKERLKMPLTKVEEELAGLWVDYKEASDDLLNSVTTSRLLYDSNKAAGAKIAETPGLRERCRSINTKYSKEAEKLLGTDIRAET